MKRLPIFLAAALCLLATSCAHTSNFRVASTRADFLKLIDRPRVALSPQIEELPPTNNIAQFHFSFATDGDERVPGILMKTTNSIGRRPVVIALHGTGGSKGNMAALSRKLAERGFIAVAIDGRYHGERKTGRGTTQYEDAIAQAFRKSGEHPFFYDTVWDVLRLLDYLATRDDVDPARIGVIGISKGGIETYLAAAVDTRIAVAVPCIAVQSFSWALKHDDWQGRIATIQPAFDKVANESGVAKPDSAFVKKFYDRVVPGIYSEFDGPKMLPLIAPRPLFVINSDSDKNTPLPGVKEAIAAAEKAYRSAKAESQFAVCIQEKTGHQVKPESERAAIDWFVLNLKP